jgi:hypothetical protein
MRKAALDVHAYGLTVQPLPTPLRISQYQAGVMHTQHSLDAFGNATAIASGKSLLNASTDAEAQHIMGFGPTTPSVDSSHRDYVASGLDSRLTTVMSGAATKIIVFALAPGWMREVPSGVTPIDDFTPDAWYVAPVATGHLTDWANLCADIASTYSDVYYFFVWNELKGHFIDAQNRWDYQRYTTMYNAVWTAVKAVRPDALIGGPYANLSSGGTASVVQSPEWGWLDKRILDSIDYWMANKTGADFVVVDGTNSNTLGTLAVEFGKYRDFMEWLRGLNTTTYPGANTLPVMIAEHYCYPPGEELAANSTDLSKYPPNWCAGTFEAIRAGYSTCLLWQPQGNDGDTTNGLSFPVGLFTDTANSGGGQATNLQPAVKLVHDHLSAGASIYWPDVGNANIDALASSTKCILVNRSGSSQSTSGFTPATTLTAYQVLAVDWSPIGYTPAVEPNHGALWQEAFNSTTNLSMLRGSFTLTGGKARAGATFTECIGTYGGAYAVTDQYSQTVISTLTGASSYTGVALRVDSLGRYYIVTLNGSGVSEIYYFDGSTYTLLTSGTYTLGTLPGTLRGEAQGTAIRLFWRGTNILSTTHSTVTSGIPGAYISVGSVTGVELESWEGDLL